jgi:6-phosphogluconolactonase
MMRWVQRLAAALGMLGLTFTSGCAGFFVYPGSLTGGGSTGSGGNYVYVANAASNTVAGFAIGTGTLTALPNSPYALGFSPAAMVINPANSILFVGSGNAIYAYSIQSNGSLNLLTNGGITLPLTGSVISMDISPDGQWLFIADGNDSTLDEYLINSSTGALGLQTGGSYSLPGAVAHAVKVAPNGGLVFLALGTAGDVVFTFNTTTGAVANSQQLAFTQPSTVSDNALAINSASSLLYIARSGSSSGVAVYTIGTAGALTAVSGSPFAAGNQPFSVALNQAGNDVYVANQLDSTISGYSVASNGVLTAVSGSPFTSGSAVTALAAERTGNYLLAAAHGGSPDLSMYSFDQTTAGKLDLSTSTTTGSQPAQAIAIAVTH